MLANTLSLYTSASSDAYRMVTRYRFKVDFLHLVRRRKAVENLGECVHSKTSRLRMLVTARSNAVLCLSSSRSSCEDGNGTLSEANIVESNADNG